MLNCLLYFELLALNSIYISSVHIPQGGGGGGILIYSIINTYVQIQFIPHEKHKLFHLQKKKNNRPGLCRRKTAVYCGNPA